MEYRPQLDALRAIAVVGVLFSHFWVEESVAGDLGVGLFFVLSGFLITRILLQRPTLAEFYERRARRLVPAFLAAMAFAIVLFPNVRATWLWHLSGLTNVLFAVSPDTAPWQLSHLWTLDTEFQFYLVWPFLVLFAPRAVLPWVCLAAIAVTGSEVFLSQVETPLDDAWGEIYPFAALLAGALLALYKGRRLWVYVLAAVCAPLTLWTLLRSHHYYELAELATFAGLVLAGSENALPIARPWLVELGKISYGVYLYHLLLWGAVQPFALQQRGPVLFLVMSAASIVVAWASYRWLERPIRRGYPRKAQPSAGAA